MPAKYRLIARELEFSLLHAPLPEKLPTEAALCQKYQCSRQTIRSALALLEQQGLIVRHQGSGSYPSRTAIGSSRRIALVLPDCGEYTAPGLIRQLRKAAEQMGWSLDCHETHGSVAEEKEILRQLLSNPPAGILISPVCDAFSACSEELFRRIRQKPIPLVFLGCPSQSVPAVCPDEAMAAEAIVSHLAPHHRKVAAILKCDDALGIARLRSLAQGMEAAELDFSPENRLLYTEQDRLRLLEGDDSLLRRFLRYYRGNCTAVICHSDEIAYRLLRFLRAERQEISVISYDNSYLAREAAITSLGEEEQTIGAAALRLLSQIQEGRDPGTVLLPQKLFVRKSG